MYNNALLLGSYIYKSMSEQKSFIHVRIRNNVPSLFYGTVAAVKVGSVGL